MKTRYQPICKKCGKQIAFVKTAQGANMPVEPVAIYAVEDPKGDLSIITEYGRIVRVREARPGDRNMLIGNVPHWIKCEGAKEIKKEYGEQRKRENTRTKVRKTEEDKKVQPVKQQQQHTTEQLRLFGG